MARLVRPHRSQEAGGGAARAETLVLAVYDAGAGAMTTGQVGQGAIAIGASHRGVGGRQAGGAAFCWLAEGLAVNQSTGRRFTGIERRALRSSMQAPRDDNGKR
eukprot:COSAG01_NODE_37880_length_497_cov_2.015075_1_plen_104_part_00